MAKINTRAKSSLINYLKSMMFLKQVLFLFGLFLGIVFLIQLWLRFYTNHGQQLELPKFIGMDITDAQEKAEDLSFEIIVIDSIFVVGKKGGLITDQSPKPSSLVKENRKIYVTVTKFGSEMVKVSDLPTLYGNPFEQKKTELKYRDIDCIIKDYAYDPGEPNHILEVWYKGELIISKDQKKSDISIAKGDKLECIVSRRDGGEVTIPDLKCLEVNEARFLLETSKLDIGDIIKRGTSEPDAVLYVIAQSPPYDGISNIKMGEKVNVTVAAVKPADCQ